ncbi:MAG: methyltransferase domain-containing protein [Bacteroidia bacterium]|nr:methyltransferase domain-containing protein [Bacteroidia bacterium]MDW8235110.1 methyltransferase domain-containing protein [Bacteroidia bacterium]
MRIEALEYLGCPRCKEKLEVIRVDNQEGEHIMEGELVCTACNTRYPVVRGIPRLLPPEVMDADWYERTVRRFGKQWHIFKEAHHDFYESQFLSFIQPVRPEHFRDKVVLDAGCGKGRHILLAARWGAKAVIGVDLSEAVEVSFAHTRHLPHVHIVQGDIFHLPLQPNKIDYAYSVGVIHHTPDPAQAFRSIAKVVNPGGTLSVWVYGRENNGWITSLVNPVRKHFTSRMPSWLLKLLSFILTIPVYLSAKTIYRIKSLSTILPYYDYIAHLGDFSFGEIWSITYDHLTPSIAYYLTREEFESYWRSVGITPQLVWRNRNSWAGFGQIPLSVHASEKPVIA